MLLAKFPKGNQIVQGSQNYILSLHIHIHTHILQFIIILFAFSFAFYTLRLPIPFIPPISNVISFKFLFDSFVLAVLGFCISLSMGKPIAAMFSYNLDATHELFSEVVF